MQRRSRRKNIRGNIHDATPFQHLHADWWSRSGVGVPMPLGAPFPALNEVIISPLHECASIPPKENKPMPTPAADTLDCPRTTTYS